MTVQSATIRNVNTNGDYETVESITGLTFEEGLIYTIQILNTANLKVGNAEFEVRDKIIQFKAGSDDLYLKTTGLPCDISILEEEQSA